MAVKIDASKTRQTVSEYRNCPANASSGALAIPARYHLPSTGRDSAALRKRLTTAQR